MNEDLTPIEEQALDALLAETLSESGPPDLSDEILTQLREKPTDVGSIICDDSPKRRAKSKPSTKPITVVLSVVATLAASILLAVWFRSDFNEASESIAAGPAPPNAADPMVAPSIADDPSPSIESDEPKLVESTPKAPPRGIPLVMESIAGSDRSTDAANAIERSAAAVPENVEAVALVSARVESELQAYWNAVGIVPSGEATTDEVVKRLAAVLGVDFAPESLSDPQQLQLAISRPEMARAVAQGWLRQITEGGSLRLDEPTRNALTDELAACLQADQGFDRILSGWIGGTSPNAAAFYRSVSPNKDTLVRRLAALTMNVDLRCTQCHDSYIEGNGLQQDYHAFAAFLSRGVKRGPRGQLTIDPPIKKSNPLFYELPDGRQRVAAPGIASSWMPGRLDRPIEGVRDWARELVGSPELARGVVNSLWQLVHGQPLHGRVVDPISAPHNESLDRLEEELVGDLIDSRFDISRSLALIIASPATRRAVPEPLLPENALLADDADIQAAKDAVNAFAAAMPGHTDLPMQQRLDMAMRAIGSKLGVDGQEIVAQIAPGTNKSNNRGSDRSLAADFPDRGDAYPVQWLTQIKDADGRVEHLAYLAGHSQIPKGVTAVAKATRDAGVSEPVTLHRVWWMMRP